MEDMVVVAGRVCTNPVLVYAGHLEGRMPVLSLLGCFVGMETAGVKLGSLSLKLRPVRCTGEDDICLRESRRELLTATVQLRPVAMF
jgi:hypothetical protein